MRLFQRSVLAGAVACAGLVWAGDARAADTEIAYLSLSAGATDPTGDVTATDNMDTTTGEPFSDYDVDLDLGYVVSASIGAYVRPFRFEFQYSGQSNDTDSVSADVLPASVDISGRLYSNLFMLNALYDFPIADRLTGFAGVGAGAVYCRLDIDDHVHNESGAGFAYQGILGVAYELNPMLHVTADYRIWSATDVNLPDTTLEVPFFHILEVGLRVSF